MQAVYFVSSKILSEREVRVCGVRNVFERVNRRDLQSMLYLKVKAIIILLLSLSYLYPTK
jgi:hypothetical protein